MISKEEIKKMADLARIDLPDAEIESLRGEMDSILGYVGQIKEVAGSVPPLNDKRGLGGVINRIRADQNPTESETYSKDLIAEFPDREGDYLKVKKIL